MFRRTVSLLLIPMVLSVQLAAVGHSHGDWSDGGHNTRPHIHVGLIGHHHADAPHHHSHPHSHAVHVGHESKGFDRAAFQRLLQHDDDAVYVAVNVAVSERGSCCGDHSLPAGLELAIVELFIDQSAACGMYVFRPPPADRLGPCPIYIRHLTLLI